MGVKLQQRVSHHRSRGRDKTSRLRRLPPVEERNLALRWGVSLFAIIVVAAITLLFPESASRPYYFFLAAIAVAAWYGGTVPGICALVLSATLGWRLVYDPAAAGGWNGIVIGRYAGFLAVCLLVFGLTAALNRSGRALRASNLRMGGLIQISEDAIVTIDERQCITLFNPAAEKIFGYRASDVLGKTMHILLPERFRDVHNQYVQVFSESHNALRAAHERGTIYGLRADGSEFPAEASISKFDVAGEKIMTVRLRDVSEHYAANQRLRQMAVIVESSHDAIISEDLDGVILSWNPAAEKMYGYDAAEMIGQDARRLLPQGAEDEVATAIDSARQGVSATKETIHVHKDGKALNVEVTASSIHDHNGQVVGVVTVVRDITEHKRLETQLLHSQKMEAVGRLAGGVAHDFNNLLSIIVGYSFLIQSSSSEGEPVRTAADEIMNASERAGALTRQLLAFSRKQVMNPRLVDLNDVTGSLGKMLPRLIGEDIRVLIAPGSDLLNIKVDPGQVEQVIMNLAVNARDAMPAGGRLTIETGNVSFGSEEAQARGVQSGTYVMLAVSDTGHGMDAETRAHIFEPFFTTKAPGKGTGLGLATVYGIVSQSGGHILVYSEPGQGTTFKIYFPATREAAAPEVAIRVEPTLCGSETVLLVEDEEHLRDLLAHVLRDRGYRVLLAAGGPEALRLSEGNPPIDLMLTDVIMPDMRGQVLAELMLNRYRGMAVIFMSGYTDNALAHSGELPPGVTFLQKPFSPEVVLRKVREVLDRRMKQPYQQRKAV